MIRSLNVSEVVSFKENAPNRFIDGKWEIETPIEIDRQVKDKLARQLSAEIMKTNLKKDRSAWDGASVEYKLEVILLEPEDFEGFNEWRKTKGVER